MNQQQQQQHYRPYTPSSASASPSPSNIKRNNSPASRTTTTTPTDTPTNRSPSNLKLNQAPFRSGFQPKGVYRDRTEELITARNSRQESKRLEEARLQKRLEKLIQLHFPAENNQQSATQDGQQDQNQPSLINLSQKLIGIVKHVGHDRGEFGGINLVGQNGSIRAQEQRIVRWQEDGEVKECKYCQTAFGLRIRKHHCRLCGSVVCFSPPWTTGQRERCSTMIRFEWERATESRTEKGIHGRIIQLSEQEMGIVDDPHSVLDLISSSSTNPVPAYIPPKPRKGVRVCSHCLAIILRPLSSSKHPNSNLNPSSTSDLPIKLLTIRRKLLTNLSLFDAHSKKLIGQVARREGENGSEARLVSAITTRAGLFLRDHMSLIRSLGLLETQPTPQPKPSSSTTTTTMRATRPRPSSSSSLPTSLSQPNPLASTPPNKLHVKNLSISSETNHSIHSQEDTHHILVQLNVLLEQENRIEGFLALAQSKRQLEDVASLKSSLDDLREEIANLKKSLL
ncbi:carboxypeptidase Y-deficient [Puccinia graminis f. sp. tritici]|uniref:Carboxypeptidase Y-deficient n=1 Tax=Puccinia graminis f. sp. tritici TaxID=56615 RepID=A0A5B0QDK6_PUCGR|nr:carboxypeptidase Y-deficient [Puccinia graminis f. sp. tritici]